MVVMEIITFLVSMIVLSKSTHIMIKNSVKITKLTRFGELAVGFLVLSLITTIPEMLISVIAIRGGDVGISIGSLLGSLIANICLILGVIALNKPLDLAEKTLRNLLNILPVIILIIFIFAVFPNSSKILGYFLILLYGAFIYYTIKEKTGVHILKKEGGDFHKRIFKPKEISKSFALLIIGFLGILLSCNFLIKSSASIAVILGIPEIVIGSVIIALGASLPEFTTSWEATKEGHKNLAVGNIIGESWAYVTLILGLVIVLSPVNINMSGFSELYFFVFLSILLLWAFLGSWGRRRLDRLEGMILIGLYLLFVIRSFL